MMRLGCCSHRTHHSCFKVQFAHDVLAQNGQMKLRDDTPPRTTTTTTANPTTTTRQHQYQQRDCQRKQQSLDRPTDGMAHPLAAAILMMIWIALSLK